MGANLPSAALGLDIDRFDEFCDHLLVRDHANDKVVGTYRILPPEQSYNSGGYYSENRIRPVAPDGICATAWPKWAVPACTPIPRRRDHHPALGRAGRLHRPSTAMNT